MSPVSWCNRQHMPLKKTKNNNSQNNMLSTCACLMPNFFSVSLSLWAKRLHFLIGRASSLPRHCFGTLCPLHEIGHFHFSTSAYLFNYFFFFIIFHRSGSQMRFWCIFLFGTDYTTVGAVRSGAVGKNVFGSGVTRDSLGLISIYLFFF